MCQFKTTKGNAEFAADFRYIDGWVFDLDNTLYPAEIELFHQIDQKMAEFISKELSLDRDEARRLQKHYYRYYGTTLNGLMAEHNLDPKPYLDYVHDIDLSVIQVNEKLIAALKALPGRKVIFTNGSHQHAQNVMSALDVTEFFDDIFSIETSQYRPKHNHETFTKFIEITKISPQTAVMFDDLALNLKPAHDLGMTTVWIRTHKDWGTGQNLDEDTGHIHHETDALADFLHEIRYTPKS